MRPRARRSRGSARVTVSGAKWIVDGTPVERLMLLREPYSDRPATHGRRNFELADISSFLKRALDRREQPIFHAVGDQAIDDVLTALESSGGEAWQPLRPRIEHGDMLEPAHFERAKRLGVTIVQNPSHFMLPAVMAPRLGARTARLTMMKSMIAADVPVALGSDGPINPYLNVMFASINANNPAAGDDARAGGQRLHARLGAGGDDGDAEGNAFARNAGGSGDSVPGHLHGAARRVAGDIQRADDRRRHGGARAEVEKPFFAVPTLYELDQSSVRTIRALKGLSM